MKFVPAFCIALLLGCGKKPAPVPEVSPGGQPTAAAVSKLTGAARVAAAEMDYSKTLDRLTQAARKYAAEMRTAPKSLDELVAAGYLPEAPVAPPGKKYVIDQQLRVRLQ
jgi:hypothetical protein